MGIINLLDESTINQIAAGEVVERPASVVKELLENSIDSKASSITVEIKDGGVSLIRITDNGCGFQKDDIPLAFQRHATSKIHTALDLMDIKSLGFRGEALSSVAAVAQVELLTKTQGAFVGSRYVIEGGNEISFEDVGVPDGSTLIVKNLFYNTPARKKFLRSFQTEAGYVADTVSHLALAHPEISFRFINNHQNKLFTPGNGNLKDTIYNIYGREITNALLPIHAQNDFMELSGFLAKPLISRGNRGYEHYFINGRYIKSPVITKAIEEGYHGFMMQHKHPFVALTIKTDPQLLDVNVHPQKMELRFRNQEFIFPFVTHAIQDALMHKDMIVPVSLVEEKKKKETSFSPSINKIAESNEVLPPVSKTPIESPLPVIREITEVNLGEKKSSLQKTEKVQIPEPFEVHRDQSFKKEEEAVRKNLIAQDQKKYNQQDLTDYGFLTKEAQFSHKIVGQVFDTYWIVEYGKKMFIIDQHAAHEKVLYERFVKQILKEDQEIPRQLINPPILLSLSLAEENLLELRKEELIKMGFDIEHFGDQDYAIHSVPTLLPQLEKKELLIEIIDGLSDIKKTDTPHSVLHAIATMACKAAVKGNNRLSFAEAKTLIDELLNLENPYHCPHGRPVIISMTEYELNKKFKRIVD